MGASDARTANAPNNQDLQSAIAPQLTTTGADPSTQPEIPQNEEEPASDLPFIEDWPTNDEISNLVDHDPMVIEETSEILDELRNIAHLFIIQSAQGSQAYTVAKSCKFLKRNSGWIGNFLNPLTV